jgi:hypothetical protein
MKSKFALFGAALSIASMLNYGAQAAVTEYQITISGVGEPTTVFTVPVNFTPTSFTPGFSFDLGPIRQLTNGVALIGSFTFYDVSQKGGLSDTFYRDEGAQLYSGSVSHPTLRVGRATFTNANDDHIDTIAVASIPEFSTWAMMAVGFGALALAGHRRKSEIFAS